MIGDAEREAGLLAYEQVLAFAALRRKRLPLVYVLFPILLVVAGGTPVLLIVTGVAALGGKAWIFGAVCVVSAILFALFAAWNWRRLKALDARNRALLDRLHAEYGEDLPWLEVERHMAALQSLRAEGERPAPQ